MQNSAGLCSVLLAALSLECPTKTNSRQTVWPCVPALKEGSQSPNLFLKSSCRSSIRTVPCCLFAVVESLQWFAKVQCPCCLPFLCSQLRGARIIGGTGNSVLLYAKMALPIYPIPRKPLTRASWEWFIAGGEGEDIQRGRHQADASSKAHCYNLSASLVPPKSEASILYYTWVPLPITYSSNFCWVLRDFFP